MMTADAVLCRTVLCRAVLCCAVLCCAVPSRCTSRAVVCRAHGYVMCSSPHSHSLSLPLCLFVSLSLCHSCRAHAYVMHIPLPTHTLCVSASLPLYLCLSCLSLSPCLSVSLLCPCLSLSLSRARGTTPTCCSSAHSGKVQHDRHWNSTGHPGNFNGEGLTMVEHTSHLSVVGGG